MNAKRKNNPWGYVLVAPAFLIMLTVVAFPICNVFVSSFIGEDGRFTLEYYRFFFTDKSSLSNFLFTFKVAIGTLLIALVIGYGLALYVRFSKSRISRIIGKLYILPRFIPSLVAVYALINIIRDGGFITRFCMLFGVEFKPGLLYTANGIILVNMWFSIPFCMMIIASALSGISDSIVESARDVGIPIHQIFLKFILPLTVKDVMIAGTFVFMGQIGAFTIPYLAGSNNPKMLGIALYQQISTYANQSRAVALSVIMFTVCLAGAILYIYTSMKEAAWEK